MGKRDKKHNIKKGIIDEYEIADVDRNEAREGQKRRARRWREIELQEEYVRQMNKEAIKNAEKMGVPPIGRQPTPLEAAWLRCDYILWHKLEPKAYAFMEWQRKRDPDAYKYLYKIFMPQRIMHYADHYADLLANGHYFLKRVPLADIILYYRKYKGIDTEIIVKRKGEEDKKL